MTDHEAEAALGAERRRLLAALDGASEGAGLEAGDGDGVPELSVVDQHAGGSGSETLDKEVGLALLEQVRSDLDDIDRALGRLEHGGYGLCEVCGQDIGDARLEAMPAARYCLAHQQAAEAEGRVVPGLSGEAGEGRHGR